MTPEQAAKERAFDEAITFLNEKYPSMWRRMYDRLVEESFTPEQAMTLLQTYILSQAVGGINVNTKS